MREARLILPTQDILPGTHAALATDIIALWGGYTATDGHGGWIDPASKKLMRDTTRCYDIAMEPTPANDLLLDDLAVRYGHRGKQLAMYVRHASGEVVILDIPAERAFDDIARKMVYKRAV